ncbi:Friend virus susceptibility protein 1-like [Narcine bancroftii]|uniref:Friend virus susceptibility protein 1-like n=1 Tax=Narcine bancroftii TaxID=1343680 RepID=UPI003831FF7D
MSKLRQQLCADKERHGVEPDPYRVRAMIMNGDDPDVIEDWDGNIWNDNGNNADTPQHVPNILPSPPTVHACPVRQQTSQTDRRGDDVRVEIEGIDTPVSQVDPGENTQTPAYALWPTPSTGWPRPPPLDWVEGPVGQSGNRGRKQSMIRDFSIKELAAIGDRFRQNAGETLAAWLLRVWEQGGGNVFLMPEELLGLGTLSTDIRVTAELQGRGREVDYLLTTQGDALLRVYPSPVDWDLHLQNNWRTPEEGIAVIRQQTLASALYAGRLRLWVHGGSPDEEIFTAGMHTRLVRSAQPTVRGLVLSVTSPLIGHPVTEVVHALSGLRELELGGKIYSRTAQVT